MTLKIGEAASFAKDKGKGLRPMLLRDFLSVIEKLAPETRLYLYSDTEGNDVAPLMMVGRTAQGLELVPGDWQEDPFAD